MRLMIYRQKVQCLKKKTKGTYIYLKGKIQGSEDFFEMKGTTERVRGLQNFS